MAGGLPSVNVTSGDNNLLSTIHQHYSSGPDLDKSNVYGNNLTGAVTASIPLFNGFKIVATKHQLDALEALGDLQLNQRIQNTMAAIMMKYFDIVRQTNYLGILNRSLDVSKEKLTITTTRRSVGMANDADFLQAQIDQSTIEQTIKSQQLVIAQAKADLQVLMNSKSFYTYSVSDSISVDKAIVLDSITNSIKQNPQYLSFDQIIKINETVVQQINSQRYPTLKINTSYNLSYLNNGAGSLLVNKSYGPQAGFTLQIPIYNGNMIKTQRDVAELNVTMAKQQQQSLLLAYNADAYKTYLSYQSTLQQLTEQQSNYERSQTLVKIVMQRFQNNLATMLDVKAAQLSLENSGYTLINLQFAAKASEVELKRLVYKLK
jgi:outer membrane protein TolC